MCAVSDVADRKQFIEIWLAQTSMNLLFAKHFFPPWPLSKNVSLPQTWSGTQFLTEKENDRGKNLKARVFYSFKLTFLVLVFQIKCCFVTVVIYNLLVYVVKSTVKHKESAGNGNPKCTYSKLIWKLQTQSWWLQLIHPFNSHQFTVELTFCEFQKETWIHTNQFWSITRCVCAL